METSIEHVFDAWARGRSRGAARRALTATWLAVMACAPRPAADAASPGAPAAPAAEPSLAEKYAPLFPIGAAVDSGSIHSHEALLARHFNSITTENEMKFESVE